MGRARDAPNRALAKFRGGGRRRERVPFLKLGKLLQTRTAVTNYLSCETHPQDGSLFVLTCMFERRRHRFHLLAKHLKAARP